jgi:hypothetical protein
MEALSKSDVEMDLYLRQVQALSVIKNYGAADCSGLLIRYLNYSLNPAEFTESRSPTDRHEYIENTSRVWPAFGAILRMNDSRDKLKEYCLDIHKPTNYRLACFLVLRYIDKDTFAKVEQLIDLQFISGSPASQEYLKRIEDGSEQFWGVPILNKHPSSRRHT